jgi:hypothetical protein
MNKNSVKYLQGISFLQLTPAEKTEIKSSGHATSSLVLDYQANTNLCEKIYYYYIYAKHKWFSGCADRTALLGLLINHTPALS